MSANLCIDWGNSLVKAAIIDEENKIIEARSFNDSDAGQELSQLIEIYAPKKGILCSVTNHSSEIEQALTVQLKSFVKLSNSTHVPIMNAYTSGETLGADRLGLAVAAHLQHPDKNNLVISAGTCITYNFVQKNKAFRGGIISPGVHMRLQAMHHFTDKLPAIKLEGESLLLGYDTETCMRSGAIFGAAAEIDGIVNEFQAQYPDFNAILTGGDAPLLAGKLKNKIFADPDLLLKGLNLILKHNVPQVY
ncbi:MAG: type III pantothenate kinase [Sphingobacteriales bacterium]|nr:MAG: type III pantothenate kinase [Sphingobacteriales bacterium]